jgi:hypothetical protein
VTSSVNVMVAHYTTFEGIGNTPWALGPEGGTVVRLSCPRTAACAPHTSSTINVSDVKSTGHLLQKHRWRLQRASAKAVALPANPSTSYSTLDGNVPRLETARIASKRLTCHVVTQKPLQKSLDAASWFSKPAPDAWMPHEVSPWPHECSWYSPRFRRFSVLSHVLNHFLYPP